MNVPTNLLFFLIVVIGAMSAATSNSQSPPPIIVPAGAKVTGVSVSGSPDTTETLIKSLKEIKVANEATLQKQKVTLEMLDELQKAAEQIKVYTKRT